MSRTQLLSWINDFLSLNYTKIEQCCSGIVALQVMDAMYPGMVPLSKVNWNAKNEYEYTKNLKVVQAVFMKVGIEKVVDIDKLTKGKYQDNLEFIQWLKSYFDANYKHEVEYDAVARRQHVEPKCLDRPQSARTLTDVTNENQVPNSNSHSMPSMSTTTNSLNGNVNKQQQKVTRSPSTTAPSLAGSHSRLQMKVEAQQRQIAEMKEVQVALEKQRDFYYGKLRNIEIILDDDNILNYNMQHVRSTIQSILFNPAGDFVCMETAMEDAGMEH
mmetsp:Transcript_89835/g.155627  ORF Transcript_89835/g.155627 Transcript_89835/m.155627 type:complete len:272 (-) Transcript_89835:591-1406(-)